MQEITIMLEDCKEDRTNIYERLGDGDRRMSELHRLVEDNRKAHLANQQALEENTAITKEIKDILELGKSFFRLLGVIGTVAKWVGIVATAAAAIYGLLHLGPPK
jgi:hypothetical protein